MKLITALFASTLILTMASYRQADVPITRMDTTIKPQYQYYYKLMIPVNRFNQPLDTIDMVMQRMGKSMTVDQADELRGIVVKQLRDFIGRLVVDSVKVGGGR